MKYRSFSSEPSSDKVVVKFSYDFLHKRLVSVVAGEAKKIVNLMHEDGLSCKVEEIKYNALVLTVPSENPVSTRVQIHDLLIGR